MMGNGRDSNGHTSEVGQYLTQSILKTSDDKLVFYVDQNRVKTLKEKLSLIHTATSDEGATPFFARPEIVDPIGSPSKKVVTLTPQVPLPDALGMLVHVDIISKEEAQKIDLNLKITDFTASPETGKDNSTITPS